ncbi:MAG: DUF3343 domain-containing protein [Ruminiclostridium sp.]|nr:DUF3343 domain-containing protein [Ruminiclostridium sp.]
MKNTIIPLESYTAARRAARFLNSRGIYARVVKTGSGRTGCTFGISVNEPPGIVCDILRREGIRCGDSVPLPPPRPPRPPFPPRPPRR